MKLLLMLIFITVSLYMYHVKCYSSTICLNHYVDTSDICKGRSDSLSCSHGDVIIIKSIRYAKSEKRYKSCSRCLNDYLTLDWDITPVFFKNEVYELCSQENNCTLSGKFESPPNIGQNNRQIWYAIISYACVAKGSIRDMCSPFEAVINDNGTLHVSLLGTDNASQHCGCFVHGTKDNTAINIVDYRPNDDHTKCTDDTLFYVNGVRIFQCLETISNEGTHIYNTAINITGFVTKMTVSFKETLPKMFLITIKGVNVVVQCNIVNSGISRYTSVPTSIGNTDTSLNSQEKTSHLPSGDMTQTTQHTENAVSSEVSTIPAIIGTSVAIVTFMGIIAVIVWLYRRKTSVQQKPEVTEAVYYNEGHINGECRVGGKGENKNNLSKYKVDNLYINAPSAAGHDNVENIDNVYLNENMKDSPIAGANKGEQTNARKRDKNKTREHTNQDTHYNVLGTPGEEHTYSELNCTGADKHAYYNLVKT